MALPLHACYTPCKVIVINIFKAWPLLGFDLQVLTLTFAEGTLFVCVTHLWFLICTRRVYMHSHVTSIITFTILLDQYAYFLYFKSEYCFLIVIRLYIY